MWGVAVVVLVMACLQERAQEDFPELDELEPSPWRVSLASGMRRLEGDFGGSGETEIEFRHLADKSSYVYTQPFELTPTPRNLKSGAARIGGGRL